MNFCRRRSPSFAGFVHFGAAALAAVLMLGASPAAHAQWKWKDANNRVQYSDLPPPPSVPESAVLQRPAGARRAAPVFAPSASAASVPEAAASAPRVDSELDAKRKKADADKAAATKAEADKLAATKAENCTRAKAYLKSVEEGQRMARTNAKGEREVYDDKIRAEESKRTREIIGTECK